MRQGQQNNKRMRGRNRKGPNPLTRSFESNGGDVKLRGTALHIAEKYVQLARDAHSSGDRVAAENYFQHAEHYYRIVAAAQAQMPTPQPVVRNDEGDEDDENGEFRANGNYPGERQQGVPQGNGQPFGAADPQPYLNGAAEGDDEGDGGPQGGQGGQDGGGYRQGVDATIQRQAGHGNREGGQFRRRRPFRERYDNNRGGSGDRNGNTGGGGNQGGGNNDLNGRPTPDSSDTTDD